MKNLITIASFLICVSFFACQKNIVAFNPFPDKTIPDKFIKTSYDSLGQYDTLGRPSYLTTPDTISSNLANFIATQLPKSVDLTKTHPEYFTAKASANINITQKSNIYVTFVKETASFYNTIGFYTYPTNTPPTTPANIIKITYIFPNAKFVGDGGGLKPGDKVLIGTFDPGTSVGFVLLRNAWNPITKTINRNAEHFLSADALNPEIDSTKRRHDVLIQYPAENKTLICFEDTDRSEADCDNDFSDIIFYTTSIPVK